MRSSGHFMLIVHVRAKRFPGCFTDRKRCLPKTWRAENVGPRLHDQRGLRQIWRWKTSSTADLQQSNASPGRHAERGARFGMDTTWFEDFLAVLEEGGFTRAEERRAVSQPAFSRRIKALEDWVGATLFDRTTHSVSLTAAGERLLPAAEDILRRLQIARADSSNAAQLQHDTLKLAATHVLSLTFLPIWLRSIEALAPMTGTVQLTSDNRVACEKLMIEGRAHFMLCHDHPAVATRLTP